MTEMFSERYGYQPPEAEITVREGAPIELRQAILAIAKNLNMTPKSMREIVCSVLLKTPDPYNWSDYPNVWQEVSDLVESCEWFEIYNIIEKFYSSFVDPTVDPTEAEKFAANLNQFLRKSGIGWELRDGLIMFKGSEVFEVTTREAASVLLESGRSRAADQIHESLLALSRRPEPDVTGAIHHAMGALEATARDLTGKPNPELGKLIPELNLPRPLDTAIEKLWGYSSDRARHIREGQSVNPEEAELVVTVAAAVCVFLAKRTSAQ